MLSSTVELCMAMKKNCDGSSPYAVTSFNMFSSAFTIAAGTLGVLSTITKSHRFVLVVLIVSVLTMVCDGVELIANAASEKPSVFQFIMTSLHFLLNTVGMVVFLSYFNVLRSGGTGRERMSADDLKKHIVEGPAEQGTNPFPPEPPTEETPLMP